MIGLRTRMYAIVKKVAKPPRISLPKVDPRSAMRKYRSSGLLDGGGEPFATSVACADMVLLRVRQSVGLLMVGRIVYARRAVRVLEVFPCANECVPLNECRAERR